MSDMVRYMVQAGDTLGNIAEKYDTTVQAIVRANGIKNPNMIHQGQILRIPTKHYEDDHHKHMHSGSHTKSHMGSHMDSHTGSMQTGHHTLYGKHGR